MVHEHSSWAFEEFGQAMLTDRRQVERLVSMASQLASRPNPSLPQVFPNPNDLRAAYSFLQNKRVEVDDMLSARHEACARRCDGEDVLVCPVDGSSWGFTDCDKKKGTGPIGTRKQKARGLKVMSLYALLPDGTPMGVLAEEVWARPEQAATEPNRSRPLEDKESFWWTELVRRAVSVTETTCRQPPKLWIQADCEADQISVLLQAHQLRDQHYFTVRVEDNRNLASCLFPRKKTKKGENREGKLFDALKDTEVLGRATVKVRRKGLVTRIAPVEISVASVTLRLRKEGTRTRLGDLPFTVIVVRERRDHGRGGDKPLEWILYTTYPIHSIEDAQRVVQCYALRWRIERHHYTTKTGALKLPESQLRSFAARRKWIAMNTSVSARLQHLTYRARTEPDVGALEEFEEEEIKATQCLLAGRKMKVPFSSIEGATLGQVVEGIARLGGYQGAKRSGGPAGVQTFTRGWEQVEVARSVLQGLREQKPQGARDPRQG